MPRTMSGWLIVLGWSLYGIALACPATGDGGESRSGAECLLVTLCVFPVWLVWPLMLFGVANLAFLSSPFVLCWGGGLERRAFGVFLFFCAMTTLQAFWWAPLVGCYLWVLSMFAVALGFLLAPDTARIERS